VVAELVATAGNGGVAATPPAVRRNDTPKFNYLDDEDDEDLDEEERQILRERQLNKEKEEEEGATAIDKIIDHDVTTERDVLTNQDTEVVRFLIKWRGKANIYNTWETEESLDGMLKSRKKLDNYITKMKRDDVWRKVRKYRFKTKASYHLCSTVGHLQTATPDQIEPIEIARELQRELLKDYLKVDRVIAQRQPQPTDENPNPQTEYLIKWCKLPYGEATWEPLDRVRDYQSKIDQFLAREQQQYIPRQSYQYAEALIWSPLAVGLTPNFFTDIPDLKLLCWLMQGPTT